MELVGSLLTFTMFWKLSTSLQCFSCEECPTNFNDSIRNRFLRNCDHSTMCFKRISTLDFGNGLTSQNIQRGCAAQTQDGEQKKINGKWVQLKNIYEVYDETCVEDPNNGERSTNTLLCYCRGDKCNGVDILKIPFRLLVIGLIVLVLS